MFGEPQLLEIYNAKVVDAQALVEGQVRTQTGRTNGEPLNSAMRSTIERRTRAVAERAMWTEVGNRVAALCCGQ